MSCYQQLKSLLFIHYLCGVLQLVQWLSYFMLDEDLQQHNNNAMTQI